MEPYEELFSICVAFSRRDLHSIVVLGQLLFTIFQYLPNLTDKRKHAVCGRLCLCLGILQEAMLEGFVGARCRSCHLNNAQCCCHVHINFRDHTLETSNPQLYLNSTIRWVRDWIPTHPLFRLMQRTSLQKDMWPELFRLNLFKMQIFICFLGVAQSRWETALSEFLTESWNASESWNLLHPCLIYGCFALYSRVHYIGESSITFEGRVISHAKKYASLDFHAGLTGNRSQRLYQIMLELRFRRMIYLPLHIWSGWVNKYFRLEKEVSMIWVRNPHMNTLGKRDMEKSHITADQFQLPKRRRFTLVKRLVKLRRRKFGGTGVLLTKDQLRSKQQYERKRHAYYVKLVARLARRFLYDSVNFSELRIVQSVRRLKHRGLGQIIKIGNCILTGPTRSIFFRNLALALRGRKDVLYSHFSMNHAMFCLPRVTSSIKKKLQGWQSQMQKQGLYVILRLRLSKGTSKSILQTFENTTKWGSTRLEDCHCSCHLFRGFPLPLVENHVMFPLSHVIGLLCNEMPKEWNVKTRLPTPWSEIEREFAKRVDSLHCRVVRKVCKLSDVPLDLVQVPEIPSLTEGVMYQAWVHETGCCKFPKLIEEVPRLANLLRHFVVGPIDKCRGEAFVACPLQWSLAAEKMGAEYDEMSVTEYDALLQRMFKLGSRFQTLVFSKLRRASAHRFGVLRIWPKLRSFKTVPADWQSIAYRPLVAYSRHFWRHSISFLGRFCTFVAKFLHLGFPVDNPQDIIAKTQDFNTRWSATSDEMHSDLELFWDIRDIENFFPMTTRARANTVVRKYVQVLLAQNPDLPFFCISKVPRLQRMAPNIVSSQIRKREYRWVKRSFLSTRVSRFEYGMKLNDIESLPILDHEADAIIVQGRPKRPKPDSGLNIGSGYSATVASLVAADEEQQEIDQWSDIVREKFSKHALVMRYQDDTAYFRFGESQVPELAFVFSRFLNRDFYGGGLQLKVVDENKAFGFRVVVRDHCVQLQILQKFVNDDLSKWVANAHSFRFNVGQGFCTSHAIHAEVTGYFVALLDKTNAHPREVVLQIARLVCEMRSRSVPSRTIERSLYRVLKMTEARIPRSVLGISALPLTTLRHMKEGYDRHAKHDDDKICEAQKARWSQV